MLHFYKVPTSPIHIQILKITTDGGAPTIWSHVTAGVRPVKVG